MQPTNICTNENQSTHTEFMKFGQINSLYKFSLNLYHLYAIDEPIRQMTTLFNDFDYNCTSERCQKHPAIRLFNTKHWWSLHLR